MNTNTKKTFKIVVTNILIALKTCKMTWKDF